MFSSFCPEIVEGLLAVRGEEPYQINSLKNNMYKPDTYELWEGVHGINIAEKFMTPDIVKQIRSQYGTLGVWFGKTACPENQDLYSRIFDNRVDYFFSDKPLIAMEARSKVQIKRI